LSIISKHNLKVNLDKTFGHKDFNQIEDYNEIILTYDKDGDLNSPTRSYANVKDNILVYGVVREERIDLWPQNPGSSREINGYPNPIPLEAIHRIIESSSDVGDVVLEPFCSDGVVIKMAFELNRVLIGIGVSPDPINSIVGDIRPHKMKIIG